MAQSDFIVKNGAVVLNGQNAQSTSTTTGALVIQGGIGMSGDSTVGGKINILSTTQSVSSTTGALTLAGGLGVLGDSYFGSRLFVDNVDILKFDDSIYYVSDSIGSDTNDGRRTQSAFRTIKHALSLAQPGDTVYIEPGTYSEEFPLTVPNSVSLRGAGIREVFIQPTTATNTQTAMLLNGECVVTDVTIGNFYKPGYAFAFAPGTRTVLRSPYVFRVTVLTRGSNPTATDPYGYDSNDAGGGGYFDASLVTRDSIQSAILFNEVTFITPGATALYLTNGAKCELLNGFSYFADIGIKADTGTAGWGGEGRTRLRLANTTGTFAVGQNLYYIGSTGTVLASGLIDEVTGDYIFIEGRADGFIEAIDRTGKPITTFGNTQVSSFQRKFGTGSARFTTDGDLLDIVSDADLQYGFSSYTLEAWVFLDQNNRRQQIINKGSVASTTFGLWIGADNRLAGQHGNVVFTATTTLNTGTWHHVMMSRDLNDTNRLFVNGILEATTTATGSVSNADSLTIGGVATVPNLSLRGYLDEIRISSSARFTGNFTVPTAAYNSDFSTTILVHADGADTSVSFTDDGLGSQNVYATEGDFDDPVVASAQQISLADYRQFGAELRCIGSAAVFGNYGVVADGPGIDLKLIAFNMGYVGSGKDMTDDPNLAIQANEIVKTNGAKVYYQTVDHLGDFRVGDQFRINQRNGNVDFGTANFRLGPLSSLTISDGVNTSVLQPTSIQVGSLLFGSNRVQTVSGNLVLDPSGTLTTVESDLQVNGSLNFTGQLLATSVANAVSTTTGALVVSGGVGVAKNIFVGGNATVGGNLVVRGTTTVVNSTQTSISDPVLDLGVNADNTPILVNDGLDRGLLFHYNLSATDNTSSYKRTFFGLDNTTERLIFKVGTSTGEWEPSEEPNFYDAGTWGTAELGSLILRNDTAGGSAGSGALIVNGGGSFGGNLYANIYYDSQGLIISTATIENYAVTEAIAGSDITVTGPVGNVIISNTSTLQSVTGRGSSTNHVVYFTNETNATNTQTGAVIVTGGVGVGGDLYAQNLYSNGSLVVTEGTIGSLGVTAIYAGTDTEVSSATGEITIWNTSTLESVTQRGSTTTASIVINNLTSATELNEGALVVAGGVSIGEKLYVAGEIYSNGVQVLTTETDTLQLVTERGNITDQSISITNDNPSASTFTGALVVAGGVGIGGTVNIGSGIEVGGNTNLLGNLTVNGDSVVFSSTSTQITSLGNVLVDVDTLSIEAGNTLNITAVQGTTLNSSLNITADGNASSTVTGALVVAGGAGFGGNIYAANIFSNGSQVLTNATLGEFGVTSITTGSGLLVNTSTGAVTIESIDTLDLVVQRGNTTTGQIYILNGTDSLGTDSGALVVTGGVAVNKNLVVGGTAGLKFAIITDNLQVNGPSQFQNNIESANTTTGAVVITGGLGVGGNVYATALYDRGNRVVTNVNPTAGPGIALRDRVSVGTATSFTIDNTGVIAAVGSAFLGVNTASGIVTFTNLGVHRVEAGDDISVNRNTGTVIVSVTATLQSITNRGNITTNAIVISNETDSNTSTQGALTVVGGVGVAKNLIVGGNAAIYGDLQVFGDQTFVNSTQTFIVDPVLGLGVGPDNTSLGVNDGFDRGLVLHYSNTATFDVNWDSHAFLGMDNATKTLVYKTDVYSGDNQEFPPLFSNTGTFGLAKFGGLTLTNNTSATSTTTGALIVEGGVGIGGSLYVKDQIFINGESVVTTGGIGGAGVGAIFAGTDTAVNQSEGPVTIWNISTLQSVTERGATTNQQINVTNTSSASSPSTGALVITGGLGVQQNAFVGGDLVLGNIKPENSDNNAKLYIPFRGTPGQLNTLVELQGVSANDVQNEDGGALIRFRTSTTAGYGPGIAGIRRDAGAGDLVILTGGNAQQVRVTVRDNGNVEIINQLTAGSIQNTPIGSLVRSSGAFTTLAANGQVSFTNTASSSLSSNGSVIVSGGLGIGKNIVVGDGATTRNITNANIYANGSFALTGDAQAGTYILRRAIASTLYTELTSDGQAGSTTNQLVMPNNAVYTFKVLVTARSTITNDEGAWEFNGVVKRVVGPSSVMLLKSNKTKIWSSLAGYDVEISADTINGGLRIAAKGHDGNNVRFVARVETVELTT
jgi:hypothetical protein